MPEREKNGLEAYGLARRRLEEAAEKNPDDPEPHVRLGALAELADDLDLAERSYRRASELAPESPAVHKSLGDVLSELGRLDEAEAAYARAAGLGGKGDAGAELAAKGAALKIEILRERRRLVAEPLARAEREALRIPPDPSALNKLGCLYLLDDRPAEAAESFKKAFRADSSNLQAALNLGFVQTLVTLDPSVLRTSVKELDRAIEGFPEEPRLYLHMAELYETSSLYEAAIVNVIHALDVAPSCLEAYDMGARYALLETGKKEDLEEKVERTARSAERALGGSPDDPGRRKALAWSLIGKVRFARKDEPGPLGRAEELLAPLAESDAEAALGLAECRERLGRAEEAEALLTKLASRPELEGAYRPLFELGGLYLRTGRPLRAARAFEEAARRAPEEATVFQALSFAVSGANALGTAEMTASVELRGGPGDAQVYLRLGRAYVEAGRLEAAVEALRKAAKLAPSDAVVLAALGGALSKSEDLEEAEAVLKKAVALDPSEPAPHRSLGEFYLARGRTREALAELDEYRRLSEADRAT